MRGKDSEGLSKYSDLLIQTEDMIDLPVKLEKQYKRVKLSMENASKDYEMMMKIQQELKENFQKLVQNKT